MIRSILSFKVAHQPYMVRHSYLHELRSAMSFPLAASLAEGSFTGVVAAKSFNASVVLVSLITAAPMFGNIMALLWSELSMGRRKVPLVNLLQLGVVLMIGSVALNALLPPSAAGWLFAGQIIVVRVLASGITTIRSAIWRANYPRSVRAQIISRIAAMATTGLAATTFLASYLLDQDPKAYVYLYPSVAIIGLFGIYQFSKIRVRREVLLRRREEQLYVPRPESMAQTDETNVMNYEASRFGFHRMFGQAWDVLRNDKPFRDYQRYQFMTGFAFMMFQPSLLYMVSREMTDPNQQYLLATVVVQIIPLVTSVVCAPMWAPLFDRMHVARFRVYQLSVSTAGVFILYLAAMSGSGMMALGIVVIGQLLIGISNAGGNLAWNLGHNDFTTADKSSLYMGVHVMLTGLRGCFAPFFGAGLYLMPGVGRNLFLISAILAALGTLGFASMARKLPRKVHPPARAPQAVPSPDGGLQRTVR